MARAIKDEGDRVRALAALAPQLSGEAKTAVLDEALAAARAMHEWGRARALAALAPQLSGTQLGEAFAAARAIKDEDNRAQALEALAPQLSGTQPEEALAAARAMHEWGRARALAALAPQLSGEAKTAVLDEALAAARAMHEWGRARALAALAPQLSGTQLGEALGVARAIKNERDRVVALVALAPRLSGDVKTAVLDEALAVARDAGAAEGLNTLLGLLVEADPMTCVSEIRQCLVSILDAQLAQGTCSEVLELINPEVLRWTIVGPDTVEALARHIVEIGHQWRWL